jgi:hypothetical protein
MYAFDEAIPLEKRVRIPFDPMQLQNCANWHRAESRRISANGGKFAQHNATRHVAIAACLEEEIASNGALGTLAQTIKASKLRMKYPEDPNQKKGQ